MKVYMLIVFLLLAVTGCNGNNIKSYFNEEPIKTEVIKYTYNEEKSFVFESNISKEEVFNNLSKVALNYTAYKKILNFPDGYKKITLSTDDSNLFITYSHGEVVKSNKKNKYSTSYTKINLPISIYYQNNKTKVIIKSPEKAVNVLTAGPLFMVVEPYADINKLKEDAYNIFKKIEPAKIKRKLKGAVDIKSKYPASSIASNFKRMTICDIEVGKAYSCPLKNSKTTIEIHPYKNGSRITSRIYVDYFLNADGTSTIDESKEIMVSIKKELGRIVNN